MVIFEVSDVLAASIPPALALPILLEGEDAR